jgi:hypothetical protein
MSILSGMPTRHAALFYIVTCERLTRKAPPAGSAFFSNYLYLDLIFELGTAAIVATLRGAIYNSPIILATKLLHLTAQ